jgi:hypothetical protein
MRSAAEILDEVMNPKPRVRWATYAICQGKNLDLIKVVPGEDFVAIAEGRVETRVENSAGVRVYQYLKVPDAA